MATTPQRRPRTKATVKEPSDYQPPTDEQPDDLSRQRRRQRDRRRVTSKKIVVDEVIHDPIVIEFVGVEYEIIPPKTGRILAMADQAGDSDGIAQLHEWIYRAFGEDGGGDEILDRIEDEDDPAGYDEIQVLMRKVMEHVAQNPTT